MRCRPTRTQLSLLISAVCFSLSPLVAQASVYTYIVPLKGLKAPASLAISPGVFDFGNVSIGQSATKSFSIANYGGISADGLQYLTSAHYTVTGNCGTSIAPGASCTESVTYTPTADVPQPGTLTVTNGTDSATANLSGLGLLTADQTNVGTLSFGNQAVGTTSSAQTVQLTNTGNTLVSISSITTTSSFASTTNCGSSLAIGASCSTNVTFTPSVMGAATGTLSLTTNAGTQAVSLNGTGQQALLSSNPTSVAFGNVGVNQSSSQSLTVSNTGNIAATSLAITVPSWLTYTTTCGTSLAANGTCTVSLGFTPSAVTSYSGNIQITSSANTLTMPATGTGVCNAGSQLFTSSGTFTPVAGCSTYKVMVVGGGAGGLYCDAAGWGGGSGYVSVFYSNGITSPVSVTVGAGGATTANGGQSCFGGSCVAGGNIPVCNPNGSQGLSGPLDYAGSSSGGSAGGVNSLTAAAANGGTGGGNNGDGSDAGQGSYLSSLAIFTRNAVTAGSGGPGSINSNGDSYIGGGGGGILINGSGPGGSTTNSTDGYGQGGIGYGAGGAGPDFYTIIRMLRQSGAAGAGASGAVYVEWSQ